MSPARSERSLWDRLPPELQRRIQTEALILFLRVSLDFVDEMLTFRVRKPRRPCHVPLTEAEMRDRRSLRNVMTLCKHFARTLGYPVQIDDMLPTPRVRPYDRCPLVVIPIYGVMYHIPQRRAPAAPGWEDQHCGQQWARIVSPLSYYDLAAPTDQILRVQHSCKFYDERKATDEKERRALEFWYDYVMARELYVPIDFDLKKEVDKRHSGAGYWGESWN